MKINFKNLSTIIFVLIAVLYAISNFIWWKLNTPIIPNDISAIHFNDIFINNILYYNAPLVTWIMKGMFAIFETVNFDLQVIFVNYIFFLIALYFIYKLGVELKDKKTGNIAMILFALTPAIYGMSRQYGHQDWHVMCAMIFNIYCLIKCNNFKDRKWSILYGISVGIGLLIKDEFLAYFFVPWLYVVVESLIEKIEIKKIINVIMTVLIGSLISGCHYFRIFTINKILNEPIKEVVPIFDFYSIDKVTIGLMNLLLSPPIFILFAFGFFWYIFKYKNKNKIILLIWFLVPWLIILFMPHHKEIEYTVGFVPALILVDSLWILNLKKILLKKFILITCILVCLFQFITISYSLANNFYYNLSFDFKGYNIKYFDIKSGNVYYNKQGLKQNIELVESLKKYKKYIIGVPAIYSKNIWTLALLEGLNVRHTWFVDNLIDDIIDMDIIDVIFVIGKDIAPFPIIDTVIHMTEPRVIKEFKGKYREIVSNNIISNLRKIQEEFILVESFYLENIQDENHLVKIYKKKEIH